ncbi:transposase [Streptomyces sp. NBC_01565]|uniref:transposase n=1 Tax=unclassified Streptomyces TaxID=2593676 RepID=UPI0022580133|nr:transposase [Streptomyces sp. NBC_01565]MCX4539079.1 transposase [Streptomyces sp. NBC_01565]
MPKKKPRPRRQFTADFKAEIVEMCLRGDRSVPEVVKDFDLTETVVRLWLAQADESHQPKGLERDERAELAELRRENRRLREDIEILKRATASREGDPVTVDPFIEAEKQAGHNVKRACERMKVSRSAYYARRTCAPGSRAARDAELSARIAEVHE